MSGGVSHVDTFDPKPALEQVRRPAADRQRRGRRPAGASRAADAESVPRSRSTAQSGIDVSELFPHIASHADELARPAIGVQQIERSRAGALCARLGHDPDGLPERRLMGDLRPWVGDAEPAGLCRHLRRPRRAVRRPGELERRLHAGGVSGHGFPSVGSSDRRSAAAANASRRRNSGRASICSKSSTAWISRRIPGNSELAARIESYELAYRMQGCAPEVVDLELRVGCDAEALRTWTTRSRSRSGASA